jgi:hypothetical protein
MTTTRQLSQVCCCGAAHGSEADQAAQYSAPTAGRTKRLRSTFAMLREEARFVARDGADQSGTSVACR